MSDFTSISSNVTTNQQIYKDHLNWTGLKTIYGLFQQGSNGNAPTSQPTDSNGVEVFKWNAWNAQRGKDQTQAQEEYMQFVLDTGLYNQ